MTFLPCWQSGAAHAANGIDRLAEEAGLTRVTRPWAPQEPAGFCFKRPSQNSGIHNCSLHARQSAAAKSHITLEKPKQLNRLGSAKKDSCHAKIQNVH
jgi:hypothetical protein